MFDSYLNKYDNVRMKREDGILEVALHSGGGPLVFNGYVHEALVRAFRDIGDDQENHVVILTGTGDEFCAQITPDGFDFFTPTYVGLDMASALHPQTLLCYEINGEPLSLEHGAPLRLVTPVKYGLKSIKRIGTMTFTDERPPDFWAERGYDYYLGH